MNFERIASDAVIVPGTAGGQIILSWAIISEVCNLKMLGLILQ